MFWTRYIGDNYRLAIQGEMSSKQQHIGFGSLETSGLMVHL